MEQVFKNEKQSVARGLQLGVDYVEVPDGNGYKHKIVNFENEKYCSREGIIELEALKIGNAHKHDNNVIIRRTKDKKTGLFWGLPFDIDEETKALKWTAYRLESRKILDLSIWEQAVEWAILKNSTCVEGSPNLFGKPYYKVINKEQKAAENLNRRAIRKKAEAIIDSLQGNALNEMAINLGINLDANRNLAMLTDEVYRKMEDNPADFVKLYEDPKRPYISILNRGISLGILEFNVVERVYKYNGQIMGNNKEEAVQFLMDKNNVATSIDSRCNSLEEDSKLAMASRFTDSESNSEYDEMADLKMKLALAEDKLKAQGLEEKVEFKSPFSAVSKEVAEDDAITLESLKARAKELNITGAHLMKEETLKAKIAELESK